MMIAADSCPNGEMALDTPAQCRSAQDCPQGFYCPGSLGKCCRQPVVRSFLSHHILP